MKKLLFLLVFFGNLSYGQTPEEFVNQHKKTVEYGNINIAQGFAYLGFLKQAHKLFRNGSDLWHGLKKGEFDLHNLHVLGLKKVSEAVKGYNNAKGCALLQKAILKSRLEGKKALRDCSYLNSQEVSYINEVYGNVMDKCGSNLDELAMVVVSKFKEKEKLSLSDDERLKKIDVLYSEFLGIYEFIKDFNVKFVLLNNERKQEAENNKKIGLLHGIDLRL